MRHPLEPGPPSGPSVYAYTPGFEPEISECTRSPAPPTELASPCQETSKLAAPEPRSPGWWGSPSPVRSCFSLDHSVHAFQIASGAPAAPGQLGSGVVLSFADRSVKLLNTRASRYAWPSAKPS